MYLEITLNLLKLLCMVMVRSKFMIIKGFFFFPHSIYFFFFKEDGLLNHTVG